MKIVKNQMRGGSCILYASNGYDYEEFYAAMPGSRRRDLYLCLDDGKVYIPCSFQMMWVDNSVLKSIDLYEDYEEILAPNEFILHKCKEMVQEQDISSWSKTQRINTITYFDLEGEIEEGKEFPIKKVITKPLTSENFNKFLELYKTTRSEVFATGQFWESVLHFSKDTKPVEEGLDSKELGTLIYEMVGTNNGQVQEFKKMVYDSNRTTFNHDWVNASTYTAYYL